ncbi:E3 ubiquitin-protein ligase bre1-like isoform X2 [Asparagus officinalis]|nr:E3 ubiquitin-protein ligase bre1-like isoform X2 [Asparagus officinalis]
MLGAGLAGVLFTAGVAFASLSLKGRTTSGVKQQMEPLTREQEMLFSSDNQVAKADQTKNEASTVLSDEQTKIDNCNAELQEALQVPPGKVLVPAVVDQVQGQAFTALQVLKVIEPDAQPGDLCTRREYARWLVSASSALSRNPISKVYPAMYIENVTELAFDDVTPEDPDYSCIQGLAEAGIISSKLSESDLKGTSGGEQDSFFFSSESPVSRQDLVSWKMALERRQLPEVDRNYLYKCSGYIDINRIDKDAWPALVADLSAGEQGIVALAFGYTRLFQPNKPVTKAQVAIALATGDSAEVVAEELTRLEAESLAETAVNAHTALVAEVEKELNASFEAELSKEREKINSLEKLAEEARVELERLKAERDEENNALYRGRAAVESEMEVLSRLRHEVEEQLQDLMSNKMEIAFERDRINKLRKEAESENQVIVQLQYELEVERKALSMARSWAEEEAKRAREQAKALEEARDRWESRGLKVVVDADLEEDASTGITWLSAGQQTPVDETVNRAENLVAKLKSMAAEIKIKSSAAIERVIQVILSLISSLKSMACKGSRHVMELEHSIVSKASKSIDELKENASGFSSSISDKARRAVEDCKEGVEKFTQKFKA